MKKLFAALLICITAIMAMSVSAFAEIGDILGYAKYTDIVAYINNYPIPSYNINGYTAVVVEDLRNYGFDVTWHGEYRYLSVARNEETDITGKSDVYKYSCKAGQDSFPYVETDIVTTVQGYIVTSFNIGGQTCIYIDALREYGELEWNNDTRTIKLDIPYMASRNFATIPEAPVTELYAPDGRTILVDTKDAEAYKQVGWFDEPFLIMSDDEINNAKSVRQIYGRIAGYYESEKKFRLFFGFKNENGFEMYSPAKVHIKIANLDNETVYDAVKIVKYGNFGNWTHFGQTCLEAAVEIPVSDITPGSSEKGLIYFSVTNPDYFFFEEYVLPISDLPQRKLSDECLLKLPAMPVTLIDRKYDGTIENSYRISHAQCKFEDAYGDKVKMTVYLDGEKYYDVEGGGNTTSCVVNWKLYDMDGYVVKIVILLLPSLTRGEQFKKEYTLVYDLEPGHYRLGLSVNNLG